MKFATLEGRRVAVWGLGREGRAALAALRRHLPDQSFALFCNAQEAASLSDADHVEVRTEAPDAATLSDFDVVIKSPGISLYKPEIIAAQKRGTTFTSGTALWFGENPKARVIGITGTKGKSTTAALTAHLARAAGVRTALAGNIGLPLLELDGQQADLWVIELSSFQTGEAGELEVGVVTSLYEEHLDWHGTRERYVADKLKLADVSRTLVVNATQSRLLELTANHPQRVLFGSGDGWHVHDGDLYRGSYVMDPSLVSIRHLPGLHNASNACAALAAFELVHEFGPGFPLDDIVASLTSFKPLPHRLQLIGKRDGLHYVDDSISTTPEATMAALRSLQPGTTVILGGHDRGLDWKPFAQFAERWPALRCVVQGANGPRIRQLLHDAGVSPTTVFAADDLSEAVAVARRITPMGDTILLSPGAPSFDQFRDYAERGLHFARLAGFDPDTTGTIEGLGIL